MIKNIDITGNLWYNIQQIGGRVIKELSQEDIAAINAELAKDQRVEVVPTKDGIKILRVRRDKIK